MKLNGTPRHYMPLSQSQSDDEEANIKCPKFEDSIKKSFDAPRILDKRAFEDKSSNIDPKSLPMSPLRKAAFVLSLLMCITFVTTFMWVLPCKPVVPGIDNVEDAVQKWSVILQNITFTTDVVLANAWSSYPIILFGYSSSNGDAIGKGIIALGKTDGKKLWQLPLYSEPSSLLCDYIDVNNDGLQDCLVIGVGNLMTAIDVNKGSSIWYLHNHSGIQDASNISLPVVLEDCDGDSVLDLVVSYELPDESNIAYLALVSGRTGEVIGSLIPLLQCVLPVTTQFSLQYKNRTFFVLFCSDGKKGNLWLTHAEDVCDIALNRTENLRLTLIYRNTHFSSDVQFQIVSASEASFVMVVNGSKFLVLEPKHNRKFKIVWLKTLPTVSPWRVVGHGNYVNGQNELLLLRTNNLSSEVIGLSMYSGRKLWSTTFNGSIITSVFTLKDFFDGIDGIILKIVKPVIHDSKKKCLDSFGASSDENSTMNFTDNKYYKNFKDMSGVLKKSEEGYILLEGGKQSLTKEISAEEISQCCDSIQCKPDILTSRKTALVTLTDGAVDMVVVFMNASSQSKLQTFVKLLSFEHVKRSECIYKLSC